MSGCCLYQAIGRGAAGFAAFPLSTAATKDTQELIVPRYELEVEIYEVGPKN